MGGRPRRPRLARPPREGVRGCGACSPPPGGRPPLGLLSEVRPWSERMTSMDFSGGQSRVLRLHSIRHRCAATHTRLHEPAQTSSEVAEPPAHPASVLHGVSSGGRRQAGRGGRAGGADLGGNSGPRTRPSPEAPLDAVNSGPPPPRRASLAPPCPLSGIIIHTPIHPAGFPPHSRGWKVRSQDPSVSRSTP